MKKHKEKKKIVIVGGGAGGLELIVRLAKLAKKTRLEITLVDKQLKHLWKPLLHEVASGTFTSYHDEIDYISYAYQKGFTFVLGEIKEINQKNNFITVETKLEQHQDFSLPIRKIDYDILVLATGSQVNDFNIPGVKENCLLLNDLFNAEKCHQTLLNGIINQTQQNDYQAPIEIGIIGGGATGVELAAELSYTLSKTFKFLKNKNNACNAPFKITLIESSNRVLNMMPPRISNSVHLYLTKNKINILTNTKIIKVDKNCLITDDNTQINCSVIIWAAGVRANNLALTHQLELNQINQFKVSTTLQTSPGTNIFAFGDCASCPQIDKEGNVYFVPPRAQAAHQQAKLLAKSINNLINNKPLLKYTYKDYGSLISLSHSTAVGVLMSRVAKNFYIEGKLARFTYWLLYKKHLLILKGLKYVILNSFMDFIMRNNRPEIKLH